MFNLVFSKQIQTHNTFSQNTHLLALPLKDVDLECAYRLPPSSSFQILPSSLVLVYEFHKLRIPHPGFQDAYLPPAVSFPGMFHLGRLHIELSSKFPQFGWSSS